MNKISLDVGATNGMENAIGLYYAAEKYDIADICDIAYKFMMENCNESNLYMLFKMAKAFNLANLEARCLSFLQENTYNVLLYFLGINNLNDDVLSEFMVPESLSVKHEYELYIALEIMVQSEKLSSYSQCLALIRFLEMDSENIMNCDLLSVEEKFAVIANIEVLKHHEVPIVPMSSHLSKEIKPRKKIEFQ